MKEIQPTDKLELTEKGKEIWEECAPQYRYIINLIMNAGLEYSDVLPTFLNEHDHFNIMFVCDHHLRLDEQQRRNEQLIKMIQESRQKNRRHNVAATT